MPAHRPNAHRACQRLGPGLRIKCRPDEQTATILDLYRTEAAHSRAILAAADLDDYARRARTRPAGGARSLRWIVLHMIEETARHNGYADLMREAIDGSTGE
ncbi:MAG TPA: DUF664 domain-containing protein [Chloroflexota bacterium]|jgi:hypothetical protein|nr:DUF664 domain-containing protein [Chloroflexota bacterium]